MRTAPFSATKRSHARPSHKPGGTATDPVKAKDERICCFCGGVIEGGPLPPRPGPEPGRRTGYIHPDCLSVTSVIYGND